MATGCRYLCRRAQAAVQISAPYSPANGLTCSISRCHTVPSWHTRLFSMLPAGRLSSEHSILCRTRRSSSTPRCCWRRSRAVRRGDLMPCSVSAWLPKDLSNRPTGLILLCCRMSSTWHHTRSPNHSCCRARVRSSCSWVGWCPVRAAWCYYKLSSSWSPGTLTKNYEW